MNEDCDSNLGLDDTAVRDHETGPETSQTQPLLVDIIIEDGDWSAFAPVEPAIRQAADALAAVAGLCDRPSIAALALSSDARVKKLNETYRAKPVPTNVLSFPTPPDAPQEPDEPRALGDIVMAAETIAREAIEMGIPPRHHLQHLVVHGLLHLLGFDHQTDTQADKMESLETRILATIEVPNPYAEARDAAK